MHALLPPPPLSLADFPAETGRSRFHPGFQAAGERGSLNTLSHEACSGGSRGVFSAVHRYCRAVGLSSTLGLVLRNAWLGLFLVFCIAQSAVAQTPTAVTVTPDIMYEGDGGSRTNQVFTFTHASVQSGNETSIHHDQTGDGAATYPTDYVTGNLTRSGTTVTFNLVAIGDYVTENDERIELRIQLTNSDNSIDTYTTSILLKDGPPPSVLFNRNDFALTEGNAVNGSYGYTVKLSTDPGGTVTVTATSGDSAAVTVKSGGGSASGTTSLTFNSSNYSTAQTITAEAVGDSDSDDETVTIAHAVSATAGPYAVSEVVKFREELSGRQSDGGVVVTVRDAMKTSFFGVTVSPVDITLVEGGPSKTYTVKLDADPGETVTIWASPGDVSRVIPDTGNCDIYNNCHMTFDSSTWQTAQTVTIRAPEDLDVIDNRIIVTNSGTHSDGRSAINRDLIVTVEDNDVGTTPGITLDTTGFTVQEDHPKSWNQISSNSQDAHSKQFNFRLDSDPGGLATVTITSDNAAVEVSTGRGDNVNHFVLGPTGHSEPWNQLYRVTLTAAADTNGVSETARIVLSTSGYSGVSEVLTVQVEDDDVVSLSASKTRLTEGGSDGTALIYAHVGNYTGGDLSIPIRVRAAGTTATSGAGNDFLLYNTPATVVNGSKQSSSAGVDTEIDQVDEPDETIVIELGPLPSGKVAGTPSHLELTLVDSNPTTVTLAAASTSINESGAGNKTDVTVTLGRTLEAGESVTVPLSVTGAAVGTHYTFGLKSGGGLNTGVTLSTSNPHNAQNPALTFGSGAQVATLELVAVDNSDTTARTVSISYGTGTRVPSTALGGGLTLSGSPQAVGITDDDGTTTTVAQFASGSSSAGENAGTRNVTINLNPAPSNAITVNYTLSGSATRGTDYTISGVTSNSGSVSVSAGATSATIPVAITDDNTDESNETVVLTLTQGSGYTVGSTNAHTLTITDNDITTVTLSTPDTTAEEQNSGNTATIRLALNRGLEAGETLVVPLRFSGGTAGTHFRLACPTPRPTGVTCANLGNANAAVTFTGPGSGASATAVSLTLSVPNDDGDTSDRTVTASIPASTSGNPRLTATGLGGGASGSRSGNGQIVLADDDTVRPTVTISAGSGVTEGTAASFTVSTSITLTVALSVRVRVDDVPGSDFVASGAQGVRTVTIPANQASANFNVSTVGDSTDEASGPVSASVVNHASYVVGSPGTASVTVTDNDATTATLAGPAGDVREGNAKVLTLTLNRGLRSGESLTAPLSFAGAAGRNTDYTLSGAPATGVAYNNLNSGTATVVFTGPGTGTSAAVARITLRATADGATENPEAVDIGLGSLTPSGLDGGANGVDSLASFNIEDPPPVVPTVRFSSAASRAPEDAGTRNVTINLSPAPNTPLTLRYAVGGNAAGGDFSIANSGTLSVDSGDTAATIAVTITDDIEDENDETVVLTLTSDATYTIGSPGAHTLTIGDDDTTPVAAFASGASSVGEGAGTVNVAVRLTPPPQEDVTVNYAVADGTATAGSDYTRPSGTTLSFATGTATATIAIPIIDDNAAEGAETVVLTLGGCTGCTLGRATQHTLTIRSSDNPPTASDGTAATRPGQAYAFQVQDFGYRDPDGDALAHVTVVTLPAQGTLELGGTPVTAGAQIPQARIASGDLTFTPEPGEKGEPYASFTFAVNDGSADSAASYTLALDVRNAPPEAADGEVQLRQGQPHTFRVEDFEAGYSDADGDRLAGIVIVALPGKGMLALSGTVVTANDVAVTRGELEMGELTFMAAPGESGSPYTEFMFKVNDGFEDSLDSAKMTLHVQSVAAGRMIEQWLARFGRTVADQVIEAVEERLSNPQPPAPEASLQLRLAGRELDALRPLEDGQPMGEASDPDNPSTTPDASPLPDPRENLPARAALEASVEDALRPQRETSSLSLSDLDWLGGTSFRYARGDPAGGLSSVWGRGAISQFDGRDGSARVDGRVESLMLGADFVQDGRALGVLLSHSRGEGDYRGESGGRFDSDLTGIYPYARHEINDQLSVWGVAGYGEGELELRREASTEETDLELWMVAGGLRGQLCPSGWGWPELSALADVLWVETESDALGEVLPAADAQVSRVRIGVEGAWRALPLGDGQLSPRLRLSLRHDGGDAEHGFGTEVRAGLGWTDARRGLSAQLQAHALLTHEEDGAQEKGFSGSLAWDPRPGSLRGAEFSLTARTGDPLEQAGLLAHDSFERAAPRETRQAWQATLGYGVGAFGDRVTAVPQARLGWSGDAWDLGLGWRLVAEEFSLRLEAVRQDSETAGSDSRVQVQLQGRW